MCYVLEASKDYQDVILEIYTINAGFACPLGEKGYELKVQDHTAMLELQSVTGVLIVLPGQSAVTRNRFPSSSASWLKQGIECYHSNVPRALNGTARCWKGKRKKHAGYGTR